MFPAIPKDIPRWLYEAFRKLQQAQVQTSAGLAAVGRGETPDGTGNPLVVDLSKYFYLPGRLDGQTGYGSTASAGNLVLSSTADTTKGFIYFGINGVSTGRVATFTLCNAAACNGGVAAWGVTSGLETDAHQMIDEVVPDDITTVIAHQATGSGTYTARFTFGGLTKSSINSYRVRVKARISTAVANAGNLTIGLRFNGSLVNYAVSAINALTTAWTSYSSDITNSGDPALGIVDTDTHVSVTVNPTGAMAGAVQVSWIEITPLPDVTATMMALDETLGFLGIGTLTPAARLHLKFATPGTTTVGAIGQTLLQTTVGSNDTMTWSEYQNNASQYDVAILSGGLAAARGIYFTDYTLLTGFRFAYGTLGVGAVQYAHLQTGGLAGTGFSQNNNLLLTGMNDNMGTSFLADFRRGSFNTRVGTGEANFTTRANNGMYAFNLNADDYGSSGDADTCSVLIGQKVTATATYRVALVIEQPATTVNSFEVRTTAGGSAPAKTLGAPLLAIGPGLGSLTNEAALIGYSSGTESMRLSPIASAALQWAFLSPAGLTQIAHANTAGWADSVANSTRIELGDLHASTHRAACLLSAGGNRFTRLGICAIDGVTIENTFLGGGAAAISLPTALLYIVNNATNGADAKVLFAVNAKRTTQTGDLGQLISAVPSTVNTVWNARNVMETGRIKTAVLFTDDNATIASAKLIGFSVAGATAAKTLTLASIITLDRTITFPDYTGYFVVPVDEGASGEILQSAGAGAQPTWGAPGTLAYVAKTGTYTVLATDGIINCTSGTFTVTLLTAVGVSGQSFIIKNSGTGVITVDTTSAQTIDGETTQTISPSSSMTVASDGTNWIIV